MTDSQPNKVLGIRSITLTAKTHKTVYPAISPSRPALSQAGKTVLITGASGGLGYGIARAFGIAGADKVIIVGRDEARLASAAENLTRDSDGSHTKFEGRVCELTDPDSIDNLWDSLVADGVHVNVMVLNAVVTARFGKLSEKGWKNVWTEFEVNVRSSHQFCDRFRTHSTTEGNKYIVNISTAAIHNFPMVEQIYSYALTKNSGTLLLHLLARETPASQIQIVSVHPGAILTPGAKSLGLNETSLDWDNVDLPASAAVWAASPEAAFLHGRFIWAAWDVEELQHGELRERIENDDKFLTIGVHGL